MLFGSLLLLSSLALGGAATKPGGDSTVKDVIRARQVSSDEVVRRLQARQQSPRQGPALSKRSTTPCASTYYNNQGECCPVIPFGTASSYQAVGCCPAGHTYKSDTHMCCQNSSKKRRGLSTRSPDEPLPPFTYSPGHRTLINAEMAAKHFLGAGVFEHEGTTYTDQDALIDPSLLEGAIARVLRMSPYALSLAVPQMFVDPSGEFALSREYKIRISDLPHIANHMHAQQPDWEAIYFRGLRIDREAFQSIHHHFPADHKLRFEDLADHLKANETMA